jgi:hypothetical protein
MRNWNTNDAGVEKVCDKLLSDLELRKFIQKTMYRVERAESAYGGIEYRKGGVLSTVSYFKRHIVQRMIK